jgi:hypothetical protein
VALGYLIVAAVCLTLSRRPYPRAAGAACHVYPVMDD